MNTITLLEFSKSIITYLAILLKINNSYNLLIFFNLNEVLNTLVFLHEYLH